MDIFPSFLPVLGHAVFHAIGSQYVSRLQTHHTSREVGMRTRTRSLSVVGVMLDFHNTQYTTFTVKCHRIYLLMCVKYYLQSHACPYELFHDTDMSLHIEV